MIEIIGYLAIQAAVGFLVGLIVGYNRMVRHLAKDWENNKNAGWWEHLRKIAREHGYTIEINRGR